MRPQPTKATRYRAPMTRFYRVFDHAAYSEEVLMETRAQLSGDCEDRHLRVAVVGVGMRAIWGINAIRNHPDCNLCALVDAIPARMDLIKREFPLDGISVFTDLPTCLRQLQCDAVAAFTPDGT